MIRYSQITLGRLVRMADCAHALRSSRRDEICISALVTIPISTAHSL